MADNSPDTLCSICSSNPPKYRCPRCPAVRTCSLPCYKRHQQRATCTGRRNETTYVKKSQLATPAAIDHDYNFLAKIERSFRSAEEQSDENRTSKRRRLASNPAFNGYLLENHITVHTAPLGLQRAKTNQSRFLPKSKRVAWTVEWVGEAAMTCTTEVYGNDTVWTAYTTMAARFFNGKRKAKNRTHDKRTEEVQPDPSIESTSEAVRFDEECQKAAEKSPNGFPNDASQTQATSMDQGVHIYLLRPRCLCDKPVLIPLDSSSTLTDALRNQHLDEYPTIYHVPFAPSELPEEKYWLSSRYDTHMKQQVAALDSDDVVRSVRATLGSALGPAPPQEDKEWDSKRVLEMLRRDMEGRSM